MMTKSQSVSGWRGLLAGATVSLSAICLPFVTHAETESTLHDLLKAAGERSLAASSGAFETRASLLVYPSTPAAREVASAHAVFVDCIRGFQDTNSLGDEAARLGIMAKRFLDNKYLLLHEREESAVYDNERFLYHAAIDRASMTHTIRAQDSASEPWRIQAFSESERTEVKIDHLPTYVAFDGEVQSRVSNSELIISERSRYTDDYSPAIADFSLARWDQIPEENYVREEDQELQFLHIGGEEDIYLYSLRSTEADFYVEQVFSRKYACIVEMSSRENGEVMSDHRWFNFEQTPSGVYVPMGYAKFEAFPDKPPTVSIRNVTSWELRDVGRDEFVIPTEAYSTYNNRITGLQSDIGNESRASMARLEEAMTQTSLLAGAESISDPSAISEKANSLLSNNANAKIDLLQKMIIAAIILLTILGIVALSWRTWKRSKSEVSGA